MRRFSLSLALALAPVAASAETYPSLEEAMVGATAMATVADGYVFIARERDAWVCAINVTSRHFAALIRGDTVVAEETVPTTVCVPAAHFENAME